MEDQFELLSTCSKQCGGMELFAPAPIELLEEGSWAARAQAAAHGEEIPFAAARRITNLGDEFQFNMTLRDGDDLKPNFLIILYAQFPARADAWLERSHRNCAILQCCCYRSHLPSFHLGASHFYIH